MINLNYDNIDFLVWNMLSVEGRMNAICVLAESEIFVPDSLVVDVLGEEKYDISNYRLISEMMNEPSCIPISFLCQSGMIPRESFARAYVRKSDFRNAAQVFQYGRDFTKDAVRLENEGDYFLAMVRYEQAGNFGDASIISGMLENSFSRTKAYNILYNAHEKYIEHLNWRDME